MFLLDEGQGRSGAFIVGVRPLEGDSLQILGDHPFDGRSGLRLPRERLTLDSADDRSVLQKKDPLLTDRRRVFALAVVLVSVRPVGRQAPVAWLVPRDLYGLVRVWRDELGHEQVVGTLEPCFHLALFGLRDDPVFSESLERVVRNAPRIVQQDLRLAGAGSDADGVVPFQVKIPSVLGEVGSPDDLSGRAEVEVPDEGNAVQVVGRLRGDEREAARIVRRDVVIAVGPAGLAVQLHLALFVVAHEPAPHRKREQGAGGERKELVHDFPP